MNKVNSKVLIIIGSIIGVLLLIGASYAFFNYTRTGLSNELSTGSVDFDFSDDTVMDISNDFPQEADLSDQDFVTMKSAHSGTISVSSHNTLTNGIKYSIYVVHGDDINGKQRLDDSSIKFQFTPDFNSGSNGFIVLSNNYEEPKTLSFNYDGKALISTGLVRNTSQLTTVLYNFYMWLDASNMHVSSTMKRETLAEGNPSLADTTSGNATASRYMKNDGVLVNDVILYPASSNEEGKIVYTTNEFSNGYYNIKFVVEATEGKPLAYDKIVADASTPTTIDFSDISSDNNGKGLYLLSGTGNNSFPIYYYRGDIDNNNVIFAGLCWQIVRTTNTGGIKMILNGAPTNNGLSCENTTISTKVLSSSSAINSGNNSVSDVGYMYNTRYPYSNTSIESGAIFGKNIEWHDDHYLVVDDTANTASTNTTRDTTHHYSCGTTGTSSCNPVRYYYYYSLYYIELSGGETLEDALYKMTGNGSSAVKTRNSDYNLNETSSSVKEKLDTWFRANLTNEVDILKPNYVSYIEDTVYCNDRSLKTVTGNTDIPTSNESGWNPNGGTNKYLYFGTYNRANNNWYSTSNIPKISNTNSYYTNNNFENDACPNELDRFTVSARNGNGNLIYPVGLLTADEVILAGGQLGIDNSSYYLNIERKYWLMTPDRFSNVNSTELNITSSGSIDSNHTAYSAYVRPVISLKYGTIFNDGGDGTPNKPYVVSMNN